MRYLNLFPNLNSISMDACLAITDGSLKHLHGNRRLLFLTAIDTQVTLAGIAELKDTNHLLLVYGAGNYSYVLPAFTKGVADEEATYPAPAPVGH